VSTRWSVEDTSFDIVAEGTDDQIITLWVDTPAGPIVVGGELLIEGSIVLLKGLHVQASLRNQLGWANLKVVAQAIMKGMDIGELDIEGAARTTGASPGRRSGRLRFTRRFPAAPDS
jgi:hypothetical protein